MLGSFRFALACLVVLQHIAAVPHFGSYAVHGFFILSGFLMTGAMQRTYGYSAQGLRRFAANRALRLYPPYFAILGLTLLTIAAFGEDEVAAFRSVLYLPRNLPEIAQNLTMIFADLTPSDVRPRLVPPAWALTTEIFYYVLIAAGISRTRLRTMIWTGLSALFIIVAFLVSGHDSDLRYYSIAGGSLPFAIGALLYHEADRLRDRFGWLGARRAAAALFGLFIANGALSILYAHLIVGDLGNRGPFYYSNILISALLTLSLVLQRRPALPKAVDQRLGDYSYPIYLCHWIVGAALSLAFFGGAKPDRSLLGFGMAAATLAASMILAEAVVRYVDGPVQRLRDRVRAAARGAVERAHDQAKAATADHKRLPDSAQAN